MIGLGAAHLPRVPRPKNWLLRTFCAVKKGSSVGIEDALTQEAKLAREQHVRTQAGESPVLAAIDS